MLESEGVGLSTLFFYRTPPVAVSVYSRVILKDGQISLPSQAEEFLIFWKGNFVEKHSFRRVSTKFLLQEIR